jgi:hypothetical protein
VFLRDIKIQLSAINHLEILMVLRYDKKATALIYAEGDQSHV